MLLGNGRLLEGAASGNGGMARPANMESDNEDEENGGGGAAGAEDETHDIRGSDDDEQEDPKDYCKGGYHPITIGSVFNQRYHVIRKLGWGKVPFDRCIPHSFYLCLDRSLLHRLVVLGP